jgi:UDP-hydrolysing UDP-N-acetyl-D-glucosamine 2-epimerase
VRIVSISSSRADVGPLSAVWRALDERDVELHIVMTGMHMAAGASEVEPVPARARVHRCGADIGGKADSAAADALGSIAAGCGRIYATMRPDAVLVLGDRLDMAPAALATALFNVPLAHIHGGEITEGAVDDRIRHAVTKLADLHLVSSQSARNRVLAMSVAECAVVVTGAPGLDTLLAAPEISRDDFLRETGLARIPGAAAAFRLVTVHPETASLEPHASFRAVLAALEHDRVPALVTAANSDPGGAEINRALRAWSQQNPWTVLVDTLGARLYPNALRHAAVMVGNSSSGIIEAGLLGLPVVDVGSRQKGRERGHNVVHAESTAASIVAAIEIAARRGGTFDCRYGDGGSGARIAAALVARYAGNCRTAAL